MFYVKLFCSSIMSVCVFIVRIHMCTLDLDAGGWSGKILLCQCVCL